jgi:hypothetical protein
MAINSNSKNYLREGANLVKGDLATIKAEISAANEKKGGILWQVLTNWILYANNSVFMDGYSKKLAKQFKMDVMAETGLSEKQAASAGLGVRGVRKGMRAIDGLPAACDSLPSVQAFLMSAEIETFNKFQRAVRIDPTPVQAAAKVLLKLTPKQRDDARILADKLDEEIAEQEE